MAYFDKILFESYFDVELIQGSENKIELIGAKKAVEHVKISLSDSILTLKNNSKSLWLNPDKNKLKVKITFQNLKLIRASQTCTIYSKDTIYGDELGVIFSSKLNNANLNINYTTFYYYNDHPCGGKLTLKGNCDYLKIWNFALMQVDASELNSSFVTIENYSKGDCRVKTNNWIEYGIFGEGNIFCYGNPISIKVNNDGANGKFFLKP